MKEKTKKLILPGVALLLAILFGILMPTQLVAADAATKNRETAEGKGFTIEGFFGLHSMSKRLLRKFLLVQAKLLSATITIPCLHLSTSIKI